MLSTVRDSLQIQRITKRERGRADMSIIILRARVTMCVINLIIVFNVANCTRLKIKVRTPLWTKSRL